MFNCQDCNKTSKPRTRMYKITLETRQRNYYNIIITSRTVKNERFMQFERKDENILDNLKKQGWKVVHEVFSKGQEIVREKRICEDCNIKLEKKNDKRTNT